ncbi:MAG: hypothetical protein B6D59_06715 [Campylobacteraceae bacterium 4484_4]|nr:MAG: hypothetical protein B6D59_06715 [Campylobacteraceae bacterium 4484_4]
MALFGNKVKEGSVQKEKIASATIITHGTSIKGDLIGEDTVQIDGEVEGNIIVNNIVLIGKQGSVKGTIRATRVISSGKIIGTVKCDELEVLESSTVKERIDARKVVVFGKIEGEVACDGLIIEPKGYVGTKIQARSISVGGTISGEVAADLLSTKETGFVRANMFVNNISNEGGKVEGAIGPYKKILEMEQKSLVPEEVDSPKKEAKRKSA